MMEYIDTRNLVRQTEVRQCMSYIDEQNYSDGQDMLHEMRASRGECPKGCGSSMEWNNKYDAFFCPHCGDHLYGTDGEDKGVAPCPCDMASEWPGWAGRGDECRKCTDSKMHVTGCDQCDK